MFGKLKNMGIIEGLITYDTLFGELDRYQIKYKGKGMGRIINKRHMPDYTVTLERVNGEREEIDIRQLKRPNLALRVIGFLSGKISLNYSLINTSN